MHDHCGSLRYPRRALDVDLSFPIVAFQQVSATVEWTQNLGDYPVLHFEDRRDEFLRRPFRPWFLTGSGREQQSVFPLDQRSVRAQQRRRPDFSGDLWEAFGRDYEGTGAEK
jgi:hypothetical protein